jgi:sodium/hydrogen exchanger 8
MENDELLTFFQVFGESILNDAVAIVLASTVVESEHSGDLSSSERFWNGIGRFLVTFLGSAGE